MPDLSDKVLQEITEDDQPNFQLRAGVCDYNFVRKLARELLAYRTRPPASSMQGWRTVPEEPTREMILAAEDELENQTDGDWDSNAHGDRSYYTTRRPGWERAVFQKMLSASPIPPEVMK